MRELSKHARVIVNTVPKYFVAAGMIFASLPGAKIIHCIRDPKDNSLFIYFRRYATGNSYSFDMKDIAHSYKQYRRLIRHWDRLYGDGILTVKYEDLVARPREVAGRIFDYCGLDFDLSTLEAPFTTDEIGHWKKYERHLGPLLKGLGYGARGRSKDDDPK